MENKSGTPVVKSTRHFPRGNLVSALKYIILRVCTHMSGLHVTASWPQHGGPTRQANKLDHAQADRLTNETICMVSENKVTCSINNLCVRARARERGGGGGGGGGREK